MAKICIKKATTKCEMDDFVRLVSILFSAMTILSAVFQPIK